MYTSYLQWEKVQKVHSISPKSIHVEIVSLTTDLNKLNKTECNWLFAYIILYNSHAIFYSWTQLALNGFYVV